MNFAKTALDLFYKTFGRRILKTAADNGDKVLNEQRGFMDLSA